MKTHIRTLLLLLLTMSIHINCEESTLNHTNNVEMNNVEMNNVEMNNVDMNADINFNDMKILEDFETKLDDDVTHIEYAIDEIDATMQANETVTIEIPMRAKSEGNVTHLLIPNQARVDENVSTYEVSYSLPMVLAEGYPDRYTVHLKAPLFASTCNRVEGKIEIQTLSSAELTVRQLDSYSFSIEDFVLGTHTINAMGIFRPSDNDLELCADIISADHEIRVEMVFDVNIQRPTQLVRSWSSVSCRDVSNQIMMATSSLKGILELAMTYEDQNIISAMNAERTHPTSFTITAPMGTYLEDPELGINGVRLGPNEGTFVIESPFGSPLEYSVIHLNEVTEWSVAWSLAGLAGGGIRELEHNTSYDGPWGRTSNRILPVLTGNFIHNNEALCTSNLHPNLFTLRSQTPEICILDEQQLETIEVAGKPMGYSVSLKADGRCTLVLSAPDFNGEQGLESTMSVIINQVDTMIDPNP